MRPTKDATFLEIAAVLARRATCVRGQVGCVLVDRWGHIIGSGYNGPERGIDHCTDSPCPGATVKHAVRLGFCKAIHAEENALRQCKDKSLIAVAYITHSPCIPCVELLLNTGCKKIVFVNLHPEKWQAAAAHWLKGQKEASYRPEYRLWQQGANEIAYYSVNP